MEEVFRMVGLGGTRGGFPLFLQEPLLDLGLWQLKGFRGARREKAWSITGRFLGN